MPSLRRDHVYGICARRGNQWVRRGGRDRRRFDRRARRGSPNEAVSKKAVGPQIVPLMRRSAADARVLHARRPRHYENDEADDHFISFLRTRS